MRANDRISLEVAAGEIVGLLGHNGAGKTTLLNQIVGIAVPTSGRILVEGVTPSLTPQWLAASARCSRRHRRRWPA